MRNLIEKAVDWASIGDYPKESFTYTIDRAVIQKETGVLSIGMTLNFIMPHLDMEKVKASLIHKMEGLKGVTFTYNYQNIILREEDIVRLFIPHMIEIVNGEYTAITKSIRTDHFTWDGARLDIESLGIISTEQLNLKVAREFEALLNSYFGITAKVTFSNNEDLYEQIHGEMEAGEKHDIEESMKKYKEAKAKEAEKKPAKSNDAEGGGFGGGFGGQNGGFGGGKQGGGWKKKERNSLPKETASWGKTSWAKPIRPSWISILPWEPSSWKASSLRRKAGSSAAVTIW